MSEECDDDKGAECVMRSIFSGNPWRDPVCQAQGEDAEFRIFGQNDGNDGIDESGEFTLLIFSETGSVMGFEADSLDSLFWLSFEGVNEMWGHGEDDTLKTMFRKAGMRIVDAELEDFRQERETLICARSALDSEIERIKWKEPKTPENTARMEELKNKSQVSIPEIQESRLKLRSRSKGAKLDPLDIDALDGIIPVQRAGWAAAEARRKANAAEAEHARKLAALKAGEPVSSAGQR